MKFGPFRRSGDRSVTPPPNTESPQSLYDFRAVARKGAREQFLKLFSNKYVIILLSLVITFTLCKLAGLATDLAIGITFTVGVGVMEFFHVLTLWSALSGVILLVSYLVSGGQKEFVQEVLHHEELNMISLILLLVVGAGIAEYLVPKTNMVKVIARILPSEKFLPLAIYTLVALPIGYLNPVIGVLIALGVIFNEYRRVDGIMILGAVVSSNAIAAVSKMSDVGSVLVSKGIQMPNTIIFVLPFVVLCGLYVSIFTKSEVSHKSDHFKEKLNLFNTGQFVLIMIATIIGQTITGYLWPGMLVGLAVLIFQNAPRIEFWKFNWKMFFGFSFLPLLVYMWGLLQNGVANLFGEFTPFKTYILCQASACFDNVALTVGIIKMSIEWFFAVLGLCIGGSFLPFSSAVAAAAFAFVVLQQEKRNEEKMTLGSWALAGFPFMAIFTAMWWLYWFIMHGKTFQSLR